MKIILRRHCYAYNSHISLNVIFYSVRAADTRKCADLERWMGRLWKCHGMNSLE